MRLCIVGFGHMGKAIASGLLAKGWQSQDISVIDISPAAQENAAKLGLKCIDSPNELQNPPQMVLIAIKPQVADEVLPAYKPWVDAGATFISIMAGTTLSGLAHVLGQGAALIRTMPNMPAAIGQGMSVLCANKHVSLQGRAGAEDVLEAVGETSWLDDEQLMDAVTAVSGSGPAWYFLLTECLIEAGVKAVAFPLPCL